MGFVRVEKRGAETGHEAGLQLFQLVCAEPGAALGHALEPVEELAVAGGRHNETAGGAKIRIDRLPDFDAAQAKLADDRFGALLLAARREHCARIGAASVGERVFRAFGEDHTMAPAGQRQGLPQSGDAGASDRDLVLRGHGLRVACRYPLSGA